MTDTSRRSFLKFGFAAAATGGIGLPSLEAQSSQTRATRGFASVLAFHLIG